MKKIYLNGKYGSIIGNYALVDDDIFEEVDRYKWYVRKTNNAFYAERKTSRKNGKRLTIAMHRFIWELKNGPIPKNMIIDHKENKDKKSGLDNQIDNLRLATHQQNHFNRKSHKNTSSKYKGIYWNKKSKKWQVGIKLNGKRIYLGYFDQEIDAAYVYDYFAIQLFKDRACLNFPKQSDDFYQKIITKKAKHSRSSIYNGCSYHKLCKKFTTTFHNGKQIIYLGVFNSEVEAAQAYDRAIIKYNGNKEKLNFPELLDEYIKEVA